MFVYVKMSHCSDAGSRHFPLSAHISFRCFMYSRKLVLPLSHGKKAHHSLTKLQDYPSLVLTTTLSRTLSSAYNLCHTHFLSILTKASKRPKFLGYCYVLSFINEPNIPEESSLFKLPLYRLYRVLEAIH